MSLRSETAEIVRMADRDLSRLWRLIANGAPADEALHDILPALIREYGSLGTVLAAEAYDAKREKAGARGGYRAFPIEPADRGAHALVGFAVSTAKSDESLRTLVLGGVQRRITDHVRLTTSNNSVQDPSSEGWVRVSAGSDCEWCAQYIDGEVRTVEGYDFDAHDWCNCDVESVFY